MKNQYLGDIGDYGKYGMLRFLQSRGISIGVNWYLTPDDVPASTDGRFTEYLSDEKMKNYDEKLFCEMKKLAFIEGKNVRMVKESGILGDAVFYDKLLDLNSLDCRKRKEKRDEWHKLGMERLSDVGLVFADPDNSLRNMKVSKKDSEKYILPNEVVDYYKRGQNVAYYHHRSRKNADGWMAEKMQIKKKEWLPKAKLLAVSAHKWSNRAYIFVVHERDYKRYKEVLDDFISSAWGTLLTNGKPFFTYEEIDKY